MGLTEPLREVATGASKFLTPIKLYVLLLFMFATDRQAPISAVPQMPPDLQAPDLQMQSAQRYCRVLEELVDIGTELARMVLQQAQTYVEASRAIDELGQRDEGFNLRIIPTPALTQDPIAGYERITRAVRRTVMLAQKLHEPSKAPPKAPPKAPSEAHVSNDRIAARKRIIRDVEDTIQRTTKDDEAERLHAELLERLDAPDLNDDIAHRPVAEIIKDICRDLGLAHAPGTHPWKRRNPDDIAILAARAAGTTSAGPRASPSPKAPPASIDITMPHCRSETKPASSETGSDPP
jgi:uncharacterized membrane protein YccC